MRVLSDGGALLAFARQYLISRHGQWVEEYKRPEYQRGPVGDYSDAAKNVYPRYNVLQAMLDAVERFTASDLGALDEARRRIVQAGMEAQSPFTERPGGRIQKAAMDEERTLFSAFLDGIDRSTLREPPQVPYRLTLSQDEVQTLLGEAQRRWGLTRAAWFPIAGDRPAGVEVFDTTKSAEGALEEVLRRALVEQQIERLIEIREWGASHELDLTCAQLYYNGAEALFMDSSLTWLVYASHESTVTIGGTALLQAIASEWPEWRDSLWTGWSWMPGGT